MRQDLTKTQSPLADEERPLQKSYEVVEKLREDLKVAQDKIELERSLAKQDPKAAHDKVANLERSLAEAEQKIIKITEHQSTSPVAVVLVDGDGCIFDWDRYIKMGFKGGELSAHDLYEGIRRHFATTSLPNESHWTIIAKVYCTFGGLVMAMNDKGIMIDLNTMHSFAVGFTKSTPGFDMVDVGQGKERADSKLQFWFNQHNLDVRCKHIILAGTHDGGYLTMLDRFKYDDRYAARNPLSSYRRCNGPKLCVHTLYPSLVNVLGVVALTSHPLKYERSNLLSEH